MENASKALLIAGAILIAILLIVIGVMILNNSSGVLDTAASNMSTQEKMIFNKKFSIYDGKKTGAVVMQLMSIIDTNNADDNNPKIKVNILGETGGDVVVPSAVKKAQEIGINKANFYTIKCEQGNSGLIEVIRIIQ